MYRAMKIVVVITWRKKVWSEQSRNYESMA